MPKKILIVLPILAYGGTEIAMGRFIQVALNLGYEVSVLVLSSDVKNFTPIPKEAKIIFRKPQKSLWQLIANAFRIRKLIKQYDIIVAAAEKRATYIVSAHSVFLKKKTLAFVHNIYAVDVMNKSKKHRFLMRHAYSTFDKVICVSKELERIFTNVAQIDKNNVCTVYPGMDFPATKKLSQTVSQEDIPTELLEKPYILNVNRVAREKHLEDLIRAFKIISTKTSANLLICGKKTDQDYFAELQKLIAQENLTERVFFIGFFSNPYPFIAGAKLLVSTSSKEGFGLVLLEALALDCPVVTTDCQVGPSEVVANGKFGKLVPVGDINAIAKAMQEQLEHPLEVDTTAKAAHLEQFSFGAFAKNVTNLLTNL